MSDDVLMTCVDVLMTVLVTVLMTVCGCVS
jgi:hypothetical protein